MNRFACRASQPKLFFVDNTLFIAHEGVVLSENGINGYAVTSPKAAFGLAPMRPGGRISLLWQWCVNREHLSLGRYAVNYKGVVPGEIAARRQFSFPHSAEPGDQVDHLLRKLPTDIEEELLSVQLLAG
jgi:hypothetical protein